MIENAHVETASFIWLIVGAVLWIAVPVAIAIIWKLKVPYFRAFRAFDRQRWHPDQTVKIALSEHINRSGRRVE